MTENKCIHSYNGICCKNVAHFNSDVECNGIEDKKQCTDWIVVNTNERIAKGIEKLCEQIQALVELKV